MLVRSLVLTATAAASPPASRISLSTVLIVDSCELGSGGNGATVVASEVLFAATTTVRAFSTSSQAHS